MSRGNTNATDLTEAHGDALPARMQTGVLDGHEDEDENGEPNETKRPVAQCLRAAVAHHRADNLSIKDSKQGPNAACRKDEKPRGERPNKRKS